MLPFGPHGLCAINLPVCRGFASVPFRTQANPRDQSRPSARAGHKSHKLAPGFPQRLVRRSKRRHPGRHFLATSCSCSRSAFLPIWCGLIHKRVPFVWVKKPDIPKRCRRLFEQVSNSSTLTKLCSPSVGFMRTQARDRPLPEYPRISNALQFKTMSKN
jgi:hypothetical protein